jgi:hypothetical protein|nr:MAG TPA: hypothetical protein [Caudoviricetes sp.]
MTNSTIIKNVSEELKKNQRSLDEIQQAVWDIIILNQLNNSQIAALFTSLMREALLQPHNKNLLEKLDITDDKLNPEVTVTIQKILTEEWMRRNL